MKYTLKNKGSLFASMVPLRTFKIYGTFPLGFFKVKKEKGFTLRNIFSFSEPVTERFLGEPEMVLWHHCHWRFLEPPFLVPQRTFQWAVLKRTIFLVWKTHFVFKLHVTPKQKHFSSYSGIRLQDTDQQPRPLVNSEERKACCTSLKSLLKWMRVARKTNNPHYEGEE